jgi:hypothetical protein
VSKTRALESATVDELVARYADICVAQDRALFHDEYSKFNKLYKEMASIDQELRKRGQSARLALQNLFDHPNAQVRLQAATESLALTPAASLGVIKAIAASSIFPQAGDAGMTLVMLERGEFKPT